MITNRLGLHARAAAKLVKLVNDLEASVTLFSEENQADASSIMEVLMLAGTKGSHITIQVQESGEEGTKALSEIIQLFSNKFGEEE